MKLWDKGGDSSEMIHRFTVGNDREMDKRLAPFDVAGSLAHAEMLYKVKLISESEWKELEAGLNEFAVICGKPDFKIPVQFEDIHSYIEFYLTEKHGETGKKVHTARSRNDQVLTAIHLYLKSELDTIGKEVSKLGKLFCDLAEKHSLDFIPGYTHTQVAMPSSIGMWLAAYAECLADDLILLDCAKQLADQNPLGTAAGYGSNFAIDRDITTELMKFGSLKINPIAAQLNRGKLEQTVAYALAQYGTTVGKFAHDCILFLCQNFSFISFPEEITTGSSIMPHKKNPDIFELVRGKTNQLRSIPTEIAVLTGNLNSGYHREFQLLKEPLFRAVDLAHEITAILLYSVPQMKVQGVDLSLPQYEGIFSVDKISELVQKGMSFRDAYVTTGTNPENQKKSAPLETTHIGSLNNLHIEGIRIKLDKALGS